MSLRQAGSWLMKKNELDSNGWRVEPQEPASGSAHLSPLLGLLNIFLHLKYTFSKKLFFTFE